MGISMHTAHGHVGVELVGAVSIYSCLWRLSQPLCLSTFTLLVAHSVRCLDFHPLHGASAWPLALCGGSLPMQAFISLRHGPRFAICEEDVKKSTHFVFVMSCICRCGLVGTDASCRLVCLEVRRGSAPVARSQATGLRCAVHARRPCARVVGASSFFHLACAMVAALGGAMRVFAQRAKDWIRSVAAGRAPKLWVLAETPLSAGRWSGSDKETRGPLCRASTPCVRPPEVARRRGCLNFT